MFLTIFPSSASLRRRDTPACDTKLVCDVGLAYMINMIQACYCENLTRLFQDLVDRECWSVVVFAKAGEVVMFLVLPACRKSTSDG